MACPVCFHDNIGPAIDDLEASCGCDCHDQQGEDDWDY